MVDISPSFDYTVIRAVNASVAQSVEQGTENPRVGGSIPPGGTIFEQVPYGTCSKILPPTKESKDASKKICRWHIFRIVALPQQSDSARRHDVSCVTVILSNDSARRLDAICATAAQSGDYARRLPYSGTNNRICGCSSSGRAPPCQGGGSEFEPRQPLQTKSACQQTGAFRLPNAPRITATHSAAAPKLSPHGFIAK